MKSKFKKSVPKNAFNLEKNTIWEREIRSQIESGMTYNEIRRLFGDNIRYYLTKMGIAAPRNAKCKINKVKNKLSLEKK